mgnify:CR=1 FL=1
MTCPITMTLVPIGTRAYRSSTSLFIIRKQPDDRFCPIDQGWFALKMTLLGLMFWTAMLVEVLYRPLFVPFFEIGQFGSTPEREARVSKYFNRALFGVSAIYIEVVAMAFLGVTKPFV